MERKEFIHLAGTAFLLLANGRLLRAEEAMLDPRRKVKLRFAVASDGHYGQPGTDYANYFDRVVSRINEEHSKKAFSFCVINGDIIHDDKTHFPAAKAALDKLKTTYYVSQGNHDHVNAEEWKSIWNIPVNHDFVSGDSAILIGTTSNEQGVYLCPDIAWFREKLEAHRDKRNVFIFIHINPGKLTKYGVDCTELLALFASHKNIRAVFNGHDHDEEGIKYKESIPYVFDSHFGGDWGTAYRGFRVVELLKDDSILTYILDPVKQINNARIDQMKAST